MPSLVFPHKVSQPLQTTVLANKAVRTVQESQSKHVTITQLNNSITQLRTSVNQLQTSVNQIRTLVKSNYNKTLVALHETENRIKSSPPNLYVTALDIKGGPIPEVFDGIFSLDPEITTYTIYNENLIYELQEQTTETIKYYNIEFYLIIDKLIDDYSSTNLTNGRYYTYTAESNQQEAKIDGLRFKVCDIGQRTNATVDCYDANDKLIASYSLWSTKKYVFDGY